jgi:hypothetical protein
MKRRFVQSTQMAAGSRGSPADRQILCQKKSGYNRAKAVGADRLTSGAADFCINGVDSATAFSPDPTTCRVEV